MRVGTEVIVCGTPQLVTVTAEEPEEAFPCAGRGDQSLAVVGAVGYDPSRDPMGFSARNALSLPVVARTGLISAEALLMLRPEMIYSSSWYWFWSPEGASRDQITSWGISSWLSPQGVFLPG